ncbi:ATP-binding protein [Vibrio mediterranei]|uniref:AAA family ATPase n=1 Tax=Vibrio mediterranei TaxID=689 RepID=A0ABX5D547_9VIBR|nr:ATP-binding protein [Vibrio mediterranei]PCD85569.1 AAA family ATPase [Vibrio mediterranei]PRQ64798.1 AAA family ATPase [Vibrio mediterranei]
MINKSLWIAVLTLCLSFPASARWDYQDDDNPVPSEDAQSLATEIAALPAKLFLTPQDNNKVRRLLAYTLDQQDREILSYDEALAVFRDDVTDEHWFDVETQYLTLNSLSHSKQRLLELASDKTFDQLTGFGPDGVTQFKQELRISTLNAEYFIFFQLRSLKTLVKEIFISPVPVIWVGIKVFFIYCILMWWLANQRRLFDQLKSHVASAVGKPPIWVRFIWYLGRASVAIAWLIAITVSLRVLSSIEALSQLSYLELFTWWILGGSIAISFILEFVHRNSFATSKAIAAHRLSTVRRYVWSFIVAGLVLQIAAQTLGKGTIYYWISSFFSFWFALITLTVIVMWKDTVFHSLEKIPEKPLWVTWATTKKDVFVIGLVATSIATLWIALHHLKNRLIGLLSQYTVFNQGLTYLFKIEVAKQTGSSADNNLVRVKGDAAFDYVLPGDDFSPLVEYAKDDFQQLSKYLLTNSPAICVITGERGIGATRLLKQMLHKVKTAEPVYVNCPLAGYNQLLVHFAVSIGLEEDASEMKILSHLRKSNTNYLIAIDNCQRLVKPKVGGLNDLIRFTNLLRRSKQSHRAVFSIEKASWRFVDRARGERLLFDWVAFLPKWTEEQIGALLDSRINQGNDNKVGFEGLVVPKQWDNDSESEEDRARQGFYRILWHYSDGNPTVALRFFRFSLRRNKDTDAVVVRLFHAPESEELDKMPKPMLAILRSIVQLEAASPEDVSDCTQLTISEVIGTLRYFQSRGYIEWKEDKARISDHWFRHITNVLDRQHLLVK